jgi:hypothetical protein
MLRRFFQDYKQLEGKAVEVDEIRPPTEAYPIIPRRLAPLAGTKDCPVYVDETIELFDLISISAGMRGMQILLAPADYIRATPATVVRLVQTES